MKKLKLLTISYLFIGLFSQMLHAQNPQRVTDNRFFLEEKKRIMRESEVMIPKDLMRNTSNLLREWQLKFKTSDSKCGSANNIYYPDSVYVKRLASIPSVFELSYNPVVASFIELYTVKRRDLLSYMLTLGDYYFPMFEEILDKYGLPMELKYLPVIESALNPFATSRSGASGLWQFMLQTGKLYGLEVNSLVDERRDPYKATEAAAKYLKDLYDIYGDWALVLAAYNCGPGNVNKAIKRSGDKLDYWQIYFYLPKETRGYIPAFIAANYAMNFYKEHNICPKEVAEITPTDTIHVSKQMHLGQIAEILKIPIDDIRKLNPSFRKDLIPASDEKSYPLVLRYSDAMKFLENEDSISSHRESFFFTKRMITQIPDEMPKKSFKAKRAIKKRKHRIRRGETIRSVARKYGVSVKQIRKWNNLRNNRLLAGRTIVIKK